MCTKSGVWQGYEHVFHVKAELTSHQNYHRTLKSRSRPSHGYLMERDGRTDREYFWQWQYRSWNKGKNREVEEQPVYLQKRNPSLGPNLHVNSCSARHIDASQLFGFHLGLCTWLDHWETVSWPYISKIYCIPFTYILHILLRVWCYIRYAIYI